MSHSHIGAGGCSRDRLPVYQAKWVVSLAAIAALLAVAPGLAARAASAGDVTVRFLPTRPAFVGEVAGKGIAGELVVMVGPKPTPVKFGTFSHRVAGGGDEWTAEARTAVARFSLTVRRQPAGPWQRTAISIRNRADEPLLMEIGWRIEARLSKPEYWGGRRVWTVPGQYEDEGPAGAYCLATIADRSACVAVGYDPGQWLSYIHNSADTASSPARLTSTTRIVIDPGRSETVVFVVGAFPTHWRHLEALHHFYRAFPRWFRPLPGVDVRASLNGGSYLIWRSRPLRDLARRLQVGWEWCYAPFRRTGDIYGRPEFWNYKPARKMSPWRAQPIDRFHAWRKSRFERGRRCDVLMAFYIPSQIWCEEQLARERYSDALIEDPRVVTRFDKPWVTGHDNELRVFPLNTSFGRQSLRDMSDLIRELKLEAFAFDVAGGNGRYYGPAVNLCPGRAWDERGVFVAESVAIAKLMDWVHEQRPEGRPLAVIANPGAYSSYLTVAHCDSAMLEDTPRTVEEGIADALRYRLGHKTMVFWETYEYEKFLREDLTRDQYIEALRGIADWTTLACLREVAFPTPRVAMGLTPLVRWLPTIRRMVLAGWEPVPAARRSDGAWVSRAGSGLDCFLATGNETPYPVKVRLAVEDRWIGPGRHLWRRVGPNSAGLTLRHTFGAQTHITTTLQPREPLVMEAIARLTKAPADLEADVSYAGDCHRGLLEIVFRRGRGDCSMVLRAPPDMRLERVEINGRGLPIRDAGKGTSQVSFALRSPARLRASFVSKTFEASEAELDAFPQRQGDRMDFAILLAQGRPDDLRRAAGWLAGYFPTYYRATHLQKVEPPEILSARAKTRGKVIVLNINPAMKRRRSIRLATPDRLVISGRTADDLLSAVKALLAVWDNKFFYAGPLPHLNIFKRVGLAGRQLPPRGSKRSDEP